MATLGWSTSGSWAAEFRPLSPVGSSGSQEWSSLSPFRVLLFTLVALAGPGQAVHSLRQDGHTWQHQRPFSRTRRTSWSIARVAAGVDSWSWQNTACVWGASRRQSVSNSGSCSLVLYVTSQPKMTSGDSSPRHRSTASSSARRPHQSSTDRGAG
eukprot:CAMPEP_0118994336 /NCGR_PEP_ID=MMETSP1173-20130426/56644_1 /TAXON_ID=1034831 /ORGANISM="Rhizochromulina marina cf, Strain CCMP1243" /LENGTH=154 /DNA_ID=CAMNT_0006945619 /DNA_START=106 /DNA_END=570 /DNA_ORIENTATION=-